MNFIQQLNQAIDQMMAHLPYLFTILGWTWAIHFVNVICQYRLCLFGIIPRFPSGLLGIFLSPFIHGSFNHIFMNSLFFVGLGSFVILQGRQVFNVVSLSIIVISGVLTWVFGRRAAHVGASSVIMGYWSFLLLHAYYNPDLIDIIAAALGMYYFGIHMAASLVASERGVSMEGHVFGFLAGGLTGAFYSKIAPTVITTANYLGLYLS